MNSTAHGSYVMEGSRIGECGQQESRSRRPTRRMEAPLR